jgi:hypothetical protein
MISLSLFAACGYTGMPRRSMPMAPRLLNEIGPHGELHPELVEERTMSLRPSSFDELRM